MQNWKVTTICLHNSGGHLYAFSRFHMKKQSIYNRSKILSRIWVFKNFKSQKFLRASLSQYKQHAEMRSSGIEPDTQHDETDASMDPRALEQSIFWTFWSFIIIALLRFQLRNFHIYQHPQICLFQRFSNKMLEIWAGVRNFDLKGLDPRYRA